MSRTISSTVLPIQRAMAGATPRAWQDGLVVEASGSLLAVAFLDGTVAELRVFDAVGLSAGEPVAYHPVAEILDAGRVATTARAA
ncbi:nuclease [Gryllotalpicola koreensis]|uniref:Nuclease n=1 Tax=Gryllotalpicola koreensis TaxID=993086 RepID=A0ABP8ACM7_9MICO